MIAKLQFYLKRIQDGRLKEMWTQTLWLYSYVRKYWFSIVLYTLIGLGGTGISLITSLLSRDLVDIVTGHKSNELLKTFIMYISFTLANVILSKILDYIATIISLKIDNAIKADIFEKMLLTRLEPLMSYHTGDLLTRWSSDASVISDGVLNWLPDLLIAIVRFLSALGIVLYYDPLFALLAIAGMPVSLLMSKTLLSRMQSRNLESAALNAKMMGFHQESFSNIQTIKAFDLIPLYVKKLHEYQKEYLQLQKKYQKLGILSSVFLSFIGLLVSYSCYGLGIYRVWSGTISYGTMTLFLSLSGTLTGTLNTLVGMVPSAINITTSSGRLMDIIKMPREDHSAAPKIDAFYQKNKQDGLSISLQDIQYAYAHGDTVFEHTDLVIEPDQIIALIGPSGEGKTTMLRILLALLEPQSGSLSIQNAKDTSVFVDYSPAIRRLFSYVPQGNAMFSGTIAQNMRNVKPDATDEEIITCLKTACAWDFVHKLPDGIYSTIGERGRGFSEGQVQRLSIARALLKKAPFLLLDEATSALDTVTEHRLLQNIMQKRAAGSCIVTTHRPTVLTICDKVYAIREKHCELLSSEDVDKILSNQQ
ncbi:peptidase domain-containing ABC transporter [Jutongia hominis]|uniref:ABC transporter ATP-binding protein n=1 Tax=Jutongia hominis TaxID=2763664 RepID=A0ABR7MTV0_9FIRM|nr:ABC transporter ATP-binding protein [Jutongia hominis]MBC8557236.1 ABC transporter ATP-binding protein [Jutongia hominis]